MFSVHEIKRNLKKETEVRVFKKNLRKAAFLASLQKKNTLTIKTLSKMQEYYSYLSVHLAKRMKKLCFERKRDNSFLTQFLDRRSSYSHQKLSGCSDS